MIVFYYNGNKYEKVSRSLYIWQGTWSGKGWTRKCYKRRLTQPYAAMINR
jgi:hypothetical protein